MKRNLIITTIVSISLLAISCTHTEKIPPPVSTVGEAKTLLTGKTWKVVDIGIISGSQKSLFDKEQNKSEVIVAPAPETIRWLSAKPGSEKQSDFTKSFYDDNLKISIGLNKDSIATIAGMEAEKQLFSINNDSEENEPKGIKLLLTGESTSFADMGVNNITATYFILGASEKQLYLLTPNKLNGLKVVFLLESK